MRHFRIALVFAVAGLAAGACEGTTPDGSAGTSAMSGSGGSSGAGAGTAPTGGTGTGGGGAGGTGVPTGAPRTCADIPCEAPAICDESSGDAECFCPDGYADIQGDGSLCEDLDECEEGTDDCGEQTKTCVNTEGGFECMGTDECAKPKTNDCHDQATCTDTATGYECECNAPWVGDGKDCDCPSGFTLSDGECLADDGADCDDDANCLHDACVDGVCCAQACDSPAVCETTTGATCTDGATCVYPTAPNGTSCTGDADPCTADECMGGVCDTSTPLVCGDGNLCTDDSCDSADTTGDPCRFVPNAVACDDGNPCTVSDACSNTFCDGVLRTCSDGNVCTTDGCDLTDFGPDPCTHTNNVNPCDDGNACTGTVASADTCSGGSCMGGATVTCDDTNPCTNDSCNMTLGCQYVNNSAPCTDNNACTGPGATGTDTCGGGVCVPGAAKNCDDGNVCKTDTCNPGDTDGDPCVHTNNAVACDDANSCTTSSSCSGGSCPTGTGNACGANSNMCTPGAGSERTCGCNTNYAEDEATDTCEPITNQCLLNPCDANATCLDPTPNPGGMTEACDPLCTCKAGYSGTGCPGQCADINECATGNPCGEDDAMPRASCSNSPAGSYTCTCNAGYTKVGNNCVCDLNGTWAIRITTDMTWSNISNISDGSATTYSWALRNHSYMPDGTLEVETIPCGGTAPTLCGNGGGVPAAAYGQFLTNQVWGIPSMPVELLSMNLPNALPGQAFVTAQTAVLLGIYLSNPLGAWPSSNNNVGSGPGSPGSNGSYWLNHDNFGDLGAESYAVPPGGIADNNSVPDPPVDLSDSTPAACGGTLSYAWWPGLDDLFAVRRVKRWSLASRVISYLDGSISTCDLITGSVKGPQNGQMQNNSRVKSCTRCSSGETAGCSDTACSNTLVDFYDNQSQPPPPTITGASFRIEPIDVSAATTTNQACEMVRALLCPGGLSCN